MQESFPTWPFLPLTDKGGLELAEERVRSARADRPTSGIAPSYLELERSRTRSEVARRETATHVLVSRRDTGDVDITTSQLRNSLEMLQLEYRHRQAYGELIAMMGQQ